jgi:PAS domain S-box-containing protein
MADLLRQAFVAGGRMVESCPSKIGDSSFKMKNSFPHNAAPFGDWWRVTLASIGDGVIATDASGRIVFLNAVAESLTGWTQSDADGRLLDEVFVIVNESTRATVENPVRKVLQKGSVVGLGNHTVLISRIGREVPIDDSAAPIRDATGNFSGWSSFLETSRNVERRKWPSRILPPSSNRRTMQLLVRPLKASLPAGTKAQKKFLGTTRKRSSDGRSQR